MQPLLQCLLGLGQQSQRCHIILAGQAQRGVGGFRQGHHIGQTGVFLLQRCPFTGLRRQFVCLCQLPQQPLAFRLAGAGSLLSFGQPGLGVLPFGPARLHRLRVDVSVGIQQFTAAVGLHQPLPGVLAVYIHQQRTQFAQLCGCDSRSIHPAPAAPLVVHGAAHQQLITFAINTRFIQPQAGERGHAKLNRHLSTQLSLTHHAGIGAVSQRQLQGINQYGLACAGFTGQRCEACAQVQRQLVNNHKVFERNALQAHRPSFQWSLLRKVSKWLQPTGCSKRSRCADCRTLMMSPCSRLVTVCMSKLALTSRPPITSTTISS